jgi:ATP-dependent Clp protease ATP-binding subunit ClpX
VGKTHALAVAAHALGLPFATTDATMLVPSGIVGEQVEDVLEVLVDAAGAHLDSSRVGRRRDDDLALAGRGIILIDEFDKIAAPEDDPSWRQAERRTIQRRLLKLAEGARLRVGVKRHDAESRDRFLDTSGILLIAAGVFEGSSGGAWSGDPSGFTTRRISPSDIVGMGFTPELVGRFPVLIRFDALSVPDLVRIIDHDEVSPVGAWRCYFDTVFGATLRIDDAAKGRIAERALGLGLGARGLQHVLFPILSAKATELVGSRGSREVVLRVSDVLPEIAAVSIAPGLVTSRLH